VAQGEYLAFFRSVAKVHNKPGHLQGLAHELAHITFMCGHLTAKRPTHFMMLVSQDFVDMSGTRTRTKSKSERTRHA
jgi:hypothetical protein